MIDHDLRQRLVEELDRLLTEDGRLTEMAAAAEYGGRPDAADRVADLLLVRPRPWPLAGGTPQTKEEAR